jgi:hypothetical protein
MAMTAQCFTGIGLRWQKPGISNQVYGHGINLKKMVARRGNPNNANQTSNLLAELAKA